MSVAKAKRSIYRKCRNCKWWSCGVWQNGEPIEDYGDCRQHGCISKDGEEEACRSFDYAQWIVKKTMDGGDE